MYSDEAREAIERKILTADEDGLSELRLWLFKETCRLENRESMIDERMERLEREREKFQQDKERAMAKIEREREALWEKDELAEQKLEMLKDAYERLDTDRLKMDRERKQLDKEKAYNEAAAYYNADAEMFFAGVNSALAVKKRYKELLKIYHPDNMYGSAHALQMIKQEYEYLCRMYQMKA
ncbi:MAG: hypothetical protein IJR00_09105 [Lachnospiraceae bacterium]|nr:hypothetical protein [Lachnospiraceae bacterium]